MDVAVGERVPLASAVAATIAGDALGNLTRSAFRQRTGEGGVSRPPRETTQAFAALTAENFFYSVSVALYAMTGAAALLAFSCPPSGRPASRSAHGGVLAVAAWVAWQRPPVASAVLSRVPFDTVAPLSSACATSRPDVRIDRTPTGASSSSSPATRRFTC